MSSGTGPAYKLRRWWRTVSSAEPKLQERVAALEAENAELTRR